MDIRVISKVKLAQCIADFLAIRKDKAVVQYDGVPICPSVTELLTGRGDHPPYRFTRSRFNPEAVH